MFKPWLIGSHHRNDCSFLSQRYENAPKIPDPATGSVAGMQQDIANFPFQYQINALAETGGKSTINGREYDFTGLGNADQASKIGDEMAQAMLDIQKNYNPQYIQQRLDDLKRADPSGYAARKQLFDKIMSDAENAPPNAQMSKDLQDQVNGMLQKSGHLDAKGLEEVQNGVRGGQTARGIFLGNAPTAQETSAVVNTSDALKSQQQQEGLQYLQSGISPQDIQFRQIQQSLANLGAFQNNQTPQAEFGQLSGAQNGAAPFNPANYSTPFELNPQGSAAAGMNFQNAQFGFQNSQANPWLAGLSTASSAFGAAGNIYNSMNRPSYSPQPYYSPAMAQPYVGAGGTTSINTSGGYGGFGGMA